MKEYQKHQTRDTTKDDFNLYFKYWQDYKKKLVHTVLQSFPVRSLVLAVSVAAVTCADVYSTGWNGGK